MRLVEIRRVSTEEQARDDRAGLARQAHSNRETAKRVGATIIEPAFELTDVCRENFISTPEWRGIRELILASDVHIVVDDPDRFVADYGGIEILGECQRTNTLIHHPGGVLDPSSLDGQLVGVIRAVLAGNELKTIKRRVQGAKEAKRREGIFPSAAVSLPTGVAYVRTKGERRGRWTYNNDIDRVREVWRMVAEEGVSNWREVGRRAGFSAVTTRNILRNPIYVGWWVVDKKRAAGPTPIRPDGRRKDRRKVPRAPHEVIRVQVFRPRRGPGEPGDDREEALVDEATWDRVQELAEAKRQGFHRLRDLNSEARFTYRGLLRCTSCGGAVYGCTKPRHGRSKVRRDWYACSLSRARGEKCSTKYLRLGMVNVGLDRLFSTILADERFAIGLMEAGADAKQEDVGAAIRAATTTVRRLTDQRTKLLDLYLAGTWGQAELDARRLKLDADRDRAERDLQRLQKVQAAADQTKTIERFREILLALREFEFWAPPQKRDFLRRFFPRVCVSKRGVEHVDVQLPSSLFGSDAVTVGGGPVTLRVGMTWEQLQPPVQLTEFGLPEKQFYTRSEVAKALGLTQHQFVGRVLKGEIPDAAQKHWGHKAWSIQEVRTILRDQAEQQATYRWGLPKKTSYTTGDITSALGITWGQLRYAMTQGRVPEPRRDAHGRRFWNETEVELMATFFGLGPTAADAGHEATSQPETH